MQTITFCHLVVTDLPRKSSSIVHFVLSCPSKSGLPPRKKTKLDGLVESRFITNAFVRPSIRWYLTWGRWTLTRRADEACWGLNNLIVSLGGTGWSIEAEASPKNEDISVNDKKSRDSKEGSRLYRTQYFPILYFQTNVCSMERNQAGKEY